MASQARGLMTRIATRGATLAAAALACLAGAVVAQEQRQLPPVVISASSLALTEAAINQHVDVFTREQIEAHLAASVGEFLVRQTGLVVDRRGRSGGYGSLFLRGADPSHVVVLIDGVRQNDPLSSRGSAVDLNSLSLEDIERIEIVRGNTSVAHGEALAGVVQLFTATQSGERRRVASEVGGDGLRALSASFKSPSWRVSASHRQDGDDRAGSVRIESLNLGYRQQSGNSALQLDFRLADSLNRSFPDDSGGVRFAVNRGLDSNDSLSRQLSALFRSDLGTLGLLEARLTRFARAGVQDTPVVAPGVRDPFGLPRVRADADYTRNEGQLQWLANAGGWDLLLGLQSQREHGALNSALFLPDPVPAAFAITRMTNSVFAEGRRTVGRLSYHLGLRSESTPGQGSVNHPAVGVQYQLRADPGRIGFGLSSAAKLPSFFALGHPIVGNPLLTRESTRQVEVYYARDSTDGSRIRLTAFRARFIDLVDFDAGPPPRLVNRASIDSSGIEFDFRKTLSNYSSARAQGTFMKVTAPEGGEPLRHRPRHQWLLGVESEPVPGWRFAGDLTHIGRRFDSSIPTGGSWLAAYNEVRLSLTRRGPRWDVYGAIDNAFGSRGEEVIGTQIGGRRLRVGFRYQL
jgi:vitamin B12 transporter